MNNTFALLSAGLVALSVGSARADQFTVLGTSASYAVLGASTVTNIDSTVLSGNLGLYPGTSITGFPPGIVINGATYSGPGPAATAQADALAGYTYLQGLAPTDTLTGQDLGGLVLTPGVYFFTATAQLTGALTLNFEGQNNANIVFQIGSTFNTAADSTVTVINQGLDDNVYYQVGSSATLGAGTVFAGDLLASASVGLAAGVDITCGNVIALNAAVTLDDNTITTCTSTGSDVTPTSTTGPGTTPEPQSLWLVATGLLGGRRLLRRRRAA